MNVATRITMATAVVVSALFLGCYLVYHYHVGSVPFRGVAVLPRVPLDVFYG